MLMLLLQFSFPCTNICQIVVEVSVAAGSSAIKLASDLFCHLRLSLHHLLNVF